MEARETTPALDTAKKIFAAAVVIVALVAFYTLSDISLFFRTIGLVVAAIIAAGIFFTTTRGKTVAKFLQEARIELRKMIWPSKVETGQTTLIVIIAVIVVAILLWLLDLMLRWFMGMLIQ